MQSRELDLAYCAGLFDGEGCVNANRGPSSGWACEIMVGLRNPEPLRFFQATLGTGKLYRRKDGMWMFQASTHQAVHVLKQLLPFLREKKRQAELFVEYAKLFGPRGSKSPQTYERRASFVQEIKALKRICVDNGVNSVNVREDHTEPSRAKETVVARTVYRLAGEDSTNTPATSAPAERHEIVGAA